MIVSRRQILLTPVAAVALPAFGADAEAHPIPDLRAALDRMYNFDFPAAQKRLDAYIGENPVHPLGYSFRASAHLFSEMDRLRVLESEFLTDDDKIKDDEERPVPSVRTRDAFVAAIERSNRLARERAPQDATALFALCMNEGMTTDYMAFIEKRQIASFSSAKRSQNYAIELMRKDPNFVDAKLTAGISEYLIGSLPFFLKWFVRMPQVDGDKRKAVANLNTVATDGHYLGPFARILLAIVHLREKRPSESERMLEGLVRDFPQNHLLRQELTKLQARRK